MVTAKGKCSHITTLIKRCSAYNVHAYHGACVCVDGVGEGRVTVCVCMCVCVCERERGDTERTQTESVHSMCTCPVWVGVSTFGPSRLLTQLVDTERNIKRAADEQGTARTLASAAIFVTFAYCSRDFTHITGTAELSELATHMCWSK